MGLLFVAKSYFCGSSILYAVHFAKTFIAALLLSLPVFVVCQPKTAVQGGPVTRNVTAVEGKPYLILVSLDGFRWDYAERFQPPNLRKFIQSGVQAESLVSSFPSKTFPNHYTIATGMYPDRHGLVDNNFFDHEKEQQYSIGNRKVVEDGTWYGGTPIWVQAAKAGMVTASFFFVGSEADVMGYRPTWYYRYDGSITNEQRVQQVLEWLALPPAVRPHFISLYFSDLDDAGHKFGPDNEEKIGNAIVKVDEALRLLFEGVENTGLPVNIIIVSDHGMSPVSVDNFVPAELIYDNERYRTVNSGALAHLYLHEGVDRDSVLADLKTREQNFTVHRTEEVPFFEAPPTHPRWGDLIVTANEGFYITSTRTIGTRKSSGNDTFGEHGFDPERKEMHGIFYAGGPALKSGLTVPSFKNIHIYPLMCRILGLDIPEDVDGKLEVLKEVLKNGEDDPSSN